MGTGKVFIMFINQYSIADQIYLSIRDCKINGVTS